MSRELEREVCSEEKVLLRRICERAKAFSIKE